MFDLHFHSDASDGEANLQTVAAAIAAHPELRRVALTDHDAIAASTRLAAEEARAWVGAELTSQTGSRRIDLLALGVRPDDAVLNDYLARRVVERRERFALFGQLLRARGWTFDPPAAVWDRPQLAQPHVVQELRRHPENIERLLALGVPAQAPVGVDDSIYATVLDELRPQIRLQTESAVLSGPQLVPMIQAAGGLAIVAHPWISPYQFGKQTRASARRLLAPLLRAGVDGLELWHSDQRDPAVLAELQALASKHHLLLSGGSDDHTADLHYLGTAVPDEPEAEAALEGLERAWRQRQ